MRSTSCSELLEQPEKSVSALLRAAEEDNPVRYAALECLARLAPGVRGATRGLRRALDSKSWRMGVFVDRLEYSPGVFVSEVANRGPAARAGIRPGDEILSVDGRALETGSADALAAILRSVPKRTIPVIVQRDGTSVGFLITRDRALDTRARLLAARALGAIGPAARPALGRLKGIVDEQMVSGFMSPGERGSAVVVTRAALDAIISIDPPRPKDVRKLSRALRRGTLGARAISARKLAALASGDAEAIDALVAVLSEKEIGATGLAEFLLQAVGRIAEKNPESMPRWLAVMKSSGPAASGVADAFQDVAPSTSTPISDLLEVLQAGEPPAQLLAIERLARIKPVSPELVDALGRALSGDILVGEKAAATLGEFDPPALRAVPALIQAFILYNSLEAVKRMGPPAIPALAGILKDGAVEPRRRAARALGFMGVQACDFLVRALSTDSNEFVRQSAAEALGRLGPSGKASIPALIEALNDNNAGVRLIAAAALGSMAVVARPAIPALILAVGRDNYHAVTALGRFGPAASEALPVLKKAMTSRNDFIRKAAVEAIGRIELPTRETPSPP